VLKRLKESSILIISVVCVLAVLFVTIYPVSQFTRGLVIGSTASLEGIMIALTVTDYLKNKIITKDSLKKSTEDKEESNLTKEELIAENTRLKRAITILMEK
jgi:uncharacterized oligopeptide transporter (OPT) family protein